MTFSNTIEIEDPDKLIKLALDYPECNDDFGPFLNVEVKIERAGTVNTRLYRKPQKKLLTLNAHSHHPNPVKEHTVLNMYRTAKSVSSNTENEKHSEKMVDELLINNGYERRVLERIKMTKPKTSKLKGNGTNKSMLKLPFLSDQCTARIKRAADKHKIPIRVVTTPGRKLKNILTSSKPLDKTQCPNNNCKTCAALKSGGKCTDANVYYHMNCAMYDCQAVERGHYDGVRHRFRPIYGVSLNKAVSDI